MFYPILSLFLWRRVLKLGVICLVVLSLCGQRGVASSPSSAGGGGLSRATVTATVQRKTVWLNNRKETMKFASNVAVEAVLGSPSLPVLEGEDVTLRCLTGDNISKPFTPSSEAIFYKNNRIIMNLTEGTLNLTAVTKDDEGFYECKKPFVRPKEDQKEKSDIETS